MPYDKHNLAFASYLFASYVRSSPKSCLSNRIKFLNLCGSSEVSFFNEAWCDPNCLLLYIHARDQQNALQLHRKLTNEHVFPMSYGKMRNHLAEEVLNKDMLNLMLEYKTSLAHQGEVLNGVIELLRNTSKMSFS